MLGSDNSYQVYKAARRTLPYIDNILTDRLKSQSIVDSILTQALFDDLRNALSKDMISANTNLQKVLANSNSMKASFKDALESQQIDKVTLYSSCIITMIVSVVCVIVVGLIWWHVLSKVNCLMDARSNCEERIPLTNFRHPVRVDWMEPTPTPLRALQ